MDEDERIDAALADLAEGTVWDPPFAGSFAEVRADDDTAAEETVVE